MGVLKYLYKGDYFPNRDRNRVWDG